MSTPTFDRSPDRAAHSGATLPVSQGRTSRRTLVGAGASTAAAAALFALIDRGAGAQDAPATQPAGGAPPSGDQGGMPAGGAPGGGESVTDEFVGVTTDGTVIPDLYPIQPTGLPLTAVREAAEAFIATLTDEQRTAVLYAVDDVEWRQWSNIDGYQRQGISIREMTDGQRTAAMGLLEASLSAGGYTKADTVMKLNHTEGELMGDFDGFDEDLYWFTVMGTPSDTDPWGWQIDGHHLVINSFVLGDQAVMAPVFMGSEPTVAPEGTDYAGLSVLLDEQDTGLALIQTFTEEQLAVAVISTEKAGEDLQAGAFADNAVLAYAGIVATDLTDEQQAQLLDVVEQYVGNLEDGHATVKMDEVRAHIEETFFAWIGETGDDAVFYYRIQSPVILIEFDHQSPGPLGRASDYYQGASGPQKAHVHTVMRTPNGNDYGKDLLGEHYATSAHHGGGALAGVGGIAGFTAVAGGAAGLRNLLPPRYQGGAPVSDAPMGSADLVYDADGAVAWDRIWGDFCDLALAGGPRHRATWLAAPSADAVRADPEAQGRVLAELDRGLSLTTGWAVRRNVRPGWIGIDCPDADAAFWMEQAIRAENVAAERDGALLRVPAGPDFRLTHEIRNVVTAVAKTHHYWTEHAAFAMA